jgi:hypothetical protein
MFGAPERLPACGVRTFSTEITTSVVQDLNLRPKFMPVATLQRF